MRTRYIANNLACTTSLYGPITYDPIFTPLFTAVLGPGIAIGATGITTTSIAAAIATTGLSKGVQIR
ncbi:hypothetical protein [Ensifer sesbaniae]|uniref:hypothetical protein n=1 Tax=Ensifer sesbaniae TaxID=1214071 RepID=UPI001569752E|nr:hypothetical protein [Ensifer sesbaniae]NRQ15587.1 hypothetical protein [Ensifer sesbaniae]